MKKIIFIFLFNILLLETIYSTTTTTTSTNNTDITNTTEKITIKPQKEVYSFQLNPDIFQSTIDKYLITLVSFYSPRCRHCKEIEEEYENLAKEINNKTENYLIAKMDDGKYYKFDEKYAVVRYPAILLFYKGQKLLEYQGNNTVNEWKNFIDQFIQNITNPFSQINQIEDGINNIGSVLIYSETTYNKYKDIFDKLPSYESFIKNYFVSEEIGKSYEIKDNSIALLKNYDEKKNVLDIDNNNFSFEVLKKFVEDNIKIYIRRITKDIYLRGFVYKEPSCFLFLNLKNKEKSDKVKEYFKNSIKKAFINEKINKKHSEKVLFVLIDISNKDKESSDYSVSKLENKEKIEKTPSLVCHDFTKNQKFYLEQKDFENQEKIEDFIVKYVNGELKYTLEAPKVELYEDDL